MRFSFLVVVAALTASMCVSATPAVFSRECGADYAACHLGSECCSGNCGYNYLCNSVAVGCAILRTSKIPRNWHVARLLAELIAMVALARQISTAS
ncbi:uncharacterized protein EDB91DRAFT_873539 [Suillus paluster]|uniref:uncharacterized protein n=1 Tax=Suillus paluster TaxID=48578 RepID=UPI001B87DBDB|nr:uncharacterized protein EDB91DRAFT_873539 [Suillus paluster]KAG1748312.1 hypothetical protein EDB91DRAFT_873539 [Suillus paluster]